MKTSTTIRRALFSLAAVALLAAAAPARAVEVRASLSAREAYVGAPIALHVEIANATSHDEPVVPDVAGLDIRADGTPSRSTQTTIINGRRTDRTSSVYSWRIVPRRAGTFEIPAIAVQVDGRTETTSPLRFVATKSETDDLLFVEVTGRQQKIYVGQPLKLTLNVWIKPYRDSKHEVTVSADDMWRMISETTNWGAFSGRISELEDNEQQPAGEEILRKDGSGAEHSYYRYQVVATIYPKRPGQVDAGDVQVVVDYPTRLEQSRDPFGSMFDSDFFRRGSSFGGSSFSPFNRRTLSVAANRPVVAQATVAPIDVTPIPTAGRPADYRGAVGRYQIVTQAVPTSVKAGDPITLHIGVTGDGPMDLVQAPPLAQLPQLSADFKVTNEPLAGIVEGEAKLFTTSIRPRRAGITQIPAIPLSFFDPATEKFVTVQSDPIAIQVAKADRLSLGSIVGASHSDQHRPEGAEPETPQFDLTNYTGGDAAVSEAESRPWPLLFALVIPPLVVMSLWAAKQRQRLTAVFSSTAQQRLRSTTHAIDTATGPSAIAAAIMSYTGAWYGIPPSALTRNEIVSRLQTNGCSREAGQFDAVVSQCEQAAYSGTGEERLAGLKSAAQRLLTQLSTIGHSPETAREPRPHNRRRVVAFACLLLAAFAIGLPATYLVIGRNAADAGRNESASVKLSADAASADALLHQLTPQQQQTLLGEANRAYQRGMQAAATDAATAKEEFSTAAAKYQQLADSGIRNDRLFCNLGNAWLQSGSVGRAIANFERALLLDAGNVQAQTNLEAARLTLAASRRSDKGSETNASLSHTLHAAVVRLNRFVSPAARMTLALAAWIALWGAVLGRMTFPSRRWRYALIPAACLLLIGTLLTGRHQFNRSQIPQGIVATQTAVLRQAPGEDFPAVNSQPLPEGESLKVISARGSWLRVQTPDGQTGWVAAAEIERPSFATGARS